MSTRLVLTLSIILSVLKPRQAEVEVPDKTGVFLNKPSSHDFVEVVRGGELAADVHMKFESFVVPRDGYLVLKFAGEETTLCPNAVENVENCTLEGEELPEHLRLTVFGIELGPQPICVEAWLYNAELVSRDCKNLVGSDKFQGRKESAEYYEDNMDEFRSDEAELLAWRRLSASLPHSACTILASGLPPNSLVFSEPANCSDFQTLFLSADSHGVVVGEAASHSPKSSLADAWDPQGPLQQQLQSGVVLHLTTEAPDLLEALDPLQRQLPLIQAVFFHLPAAINRTGLRSLVRSLEGLGAAGGGEEEGTGGFHTFLVGTERLLILNGDMWDPAFAAALGEGQEATPGARYFRYMALPFREPWYPEMLRQYNASGMMPLCAPLRLASFHTAGYDADDCPPVFGVYRSSRLRLFEHPETDALLHPFSLLRYRRNVHSEAGEDGIVAALLQALGVEHGFCFEFGAWDGLFASNCRLWFEHGWDGLMVEADPDKFQTLLRNYRNLPNVALVNALAQMEVEGVNSMAALVETHAGPGAEVTVLSIDVDGLDFLFFSSLERHPRFRPLIIIVECNGFIRPDLPVAISQEESNNNMQQSLLVFQRKGADLGYTLLCFTQNAIFVRSDLLPAVLHFLGGGPPVSVWRLYADALVTNWNDMLLNVRATRSGRPPDLVAAETQHFGSFEVHVTVEDALEQARKQELNL